MASVVRRAWGALVVTAMVVACGDDDGPPPGSEADWHGVGAACSTDADCLEEEGQRCLTDFSGGYCGIRDCTADEDCPQGSACVTHDDGVNYCFLLCIDKPDCNRNRPPSAESNCVGSITFVESNHNNDKACEPPSGS
jgi:hypothetical protein